MRTHACRPGAVLFFMLVLAFCCAAQDPAVAGENESEAILSEEFDFVVNEPIPVGKTIGQIHLELQARDDGNSTDGLGAPQSANPRQARDDPSPVTGVKTDVERGDQRQRNGDGDAQHQIAPLVDVDIAA